MKDPRIPLALPSKALFSDAALAFVDEGFWRGSLVLSLGLAREPRPLTSPEFAQVARLLIAQREALSTLHLVRLHGAFFADLGQDVLAAVEGTAKTLAKYGFQLQFETTAGPGRPYFLDDIPWIVLKTRSLDDIAGLPFNELHYTPEDGTDLHSGSGPLSLGPDLREKFYYVAKTRTAEELADFCSRSPLHWALL